MKGAVGLVLMVFGPIALILAALYGHKKYTSWQYERAIAKRNAEQELYGMKPFRGVRYDADLHQGRYP